MTDRLDYAIKIIEAYQHDIRQRGLDREGFCQGTIYLGALSEIERLRADEADKVARLERMVFLMLTIINGTLFTGGLVCDTFGEQLRELYELQRESEGDSDGT